MRRVGYSAPEKKLHFIVNKDNKNDTRNDQLVTSMPLCLLRGLENTLCYCSEEWLIYNDPVKQKVS